MVLRPAKNAAMHGDKNQQIDVLIEPTADHSDDEILSALKQKQAQEVQVLVPGYISAKIRQMDIPDIEMIGTVNIKQKSQLK